MAAETAQFAIELQDETSGAANSAASALQGLKSKIDQDQTALKQLQAAMRNLKGGTSVNIEAFRSLKDQIDAKKASVASSTEEYVKMGGAFGELGNGAEDGAEQAGNGLGGLLQVVKGAEGPMGGLFRRASQLKEGLGSAGVAGGAVLAALALVALVGAVVGAVAQLTAYAIKAADAARSQRLLAEGATGSAQAAQELQAQIQKLGSTTGNSEAALQKMGNSLALAGLKGDALRTALDAVAIASSAAGEAAGEKLKGIAEEAQKAGHFMLTAAKLEGTGLSLDDVAGALAKNLHISLAQAKEKLASGSLDLQKGLDAMDEAVKAKFGKIAQAQALSFSHQMEKLHTDVAGLFSGLKLEGFLAGLHSILSIFDQQTASGKALKAILEKVIQPIIDGLAAAMPYVSIFFKGMIIGALLLYIEVKKLANALGDVFGGSSMTKAEKMKTAMYAGVAVFGLMVAAVVGLTLAIGALLAATTLLAVIISLPFLIPIALIGLLVYAVYNLVEAFSTIELPDLGTAGDNMVEGLVNAIKGGVGSVIAAVTDLGTSAMTAFKNVLGIHSPSKVFAEYGAYTAEGFAQGVDAGADDVQSSLGRMVGKPAAVNSGSGAKGQTAGNVYQVQVTGVKDADEMNSRSFIVKLAEAIEGASITGGAPLDPEPAGA